ncbi:MAG: hypothetical protein M1820_009292 [Bogoriella megaspora]|nr:MAG: hypothetical protein M1820_009292 [Bogoriella megaspora]
MGLSLRAKSLPLVLLLRAVSPSVAALPYNPTRTFLAQQHNNLAYVLQPSLANEDQAQLLSIDLSSNFTITSPPLTTLYPSLPFTNGSSAISYLPAIDSDGNITVYAGDCSQDASGSGVWTFTPDAQSQNGNGTWEQSPLSTTNVDGKNVLDGANFLASSIAFSSSANGSNADTAFYIFGGMCPHGDTSAGSWIADANYSNSMLTLDPQLSDGNTENYGLGLTSSRGPPIAEAGFTVTPLPATFSNDSDGTRTQQQGFVLIGGHTQSAFINMSQIALFSLPQQGWTFLSVDQPSAGRSDLAKRDTDSEVEPRSGHSAVLSSDGTKIIVYGGWVGDVNTPAQPQLAVLSAGEGYGGTGSWSWTIPQQSGNEPASGSGMYGHDATMLPGDVMMIIGGSQITPSGSKNRRQARNTNVMLFNTTSNTWTTDYSPPATESGNTQKESSGPLTKTSQKVGLGTGLGVGLIAVACLGFFYWWFTRRLKAKREERIREMREYNDSSIEFRPHGFPGTEDQTGSWPASQPWSGHQRAGSDSYYFPAQNDDYALAYGNSNWRDASTHEAERTGLLLEIPSPTRGLRRGRGGFAPQRYDDKRASLGSNIHPIEERDEEEGSLKGKETPEKHTSHVSNPFSNVPNLNPFKDPDPLGSHPVGSSTEAASSMTAVTSTDRPQLISTKSDDAVQTLGGRQSPGPNVAIQDAGEREREVKGWVNDWQAADALLYNPTNNSQRPSRTGSQRTGGRISPTKLSDRTESSLSEASNRSNLSNGGASVARSFSQKSAAALLALNPFSTPQSNPENEKPFFHNHSKAPNPTAEGRPSTSRSHENDNESFTTAHTSASTQPASSSNQPSPIKLSFNAPDVPPTHRPSGTSRHYTDSAPHSSSFAHSAGDLTPTTPTKPRLGWAGSIRKALGTAAGLSSATYGGSRSVSMTSASGVPKWARSRGGSFSMDPAAAAVGGGGGEVKQVSPAKGTSSGIGVGSGSRGIVDEGGMPRRAASEGGFFWRGKKGARDWGVDQAGDGEGQGEERFVPYRDEEEKVPVRRSAVRERERRRTGRGKEVLREDNVAWMRERGISGGDGGEKEMEKEDEEDWDVEAAVERRLVQVMFTVPKQRLRVVNTDVERESLRSRSEASGPPDVETAGQASGVGQSGNVGETERGESSRARERGDDANA